MKKLLILMLTAVMALSVVQGAAVAGKKKKATKQSVDGMVAAPAPYTDNTGCYAGVQRRLAIASSEQAKGAVGDNFDLDPGTAGKPFTLEVTSGQGDVDLDIYFYDKFGTMDDVTGDPLNAGSPYTLSFNTREPGGESGIVPENMTKVIVCMYGGPEHTGVGAEFHYEAGKGVKLAEGASAPSAP
jgi:hypothetical protein